MHGRRIKCAPDKKIRLSLRAALIIAARKL